MMPNPWLLLGAVGLWIATTVGVWLYRGNIDATACQAKIETMVAAANNAAVKSLEGAAKATQAMATKQQEVVNGFENQIKRNSAALADERDTSERLRGAITLYASGSGAAGAAGLPVPEMQRRLSTLAQLYGELVVAGEAASAAADDANTKRAACERWSLIVKPQ